MSVFRVKKNANYSVVCNEHLRDRRLSLKAKGLLTIMLSLDDDWNYSIAGLVSICKEGETAVKAALGELKEYGYVAVSKVTNLENGRFEYIYDIYESPEGCLPEVENPGVENPPMGNPGVENLPLNKVLKNKGTNGRNTKERNTREEKNKQKKKFVKPDISEIREYAEESGIGIDAEAFFDYYESVGWTVGKNKPMKDWRAAVRTWCRRNRRGTCKGTDNRAAFSEAKRMLEEMI